MDIYDDVVDALGPYFSTRTADRVVKKATKQAEREGRAITGYRTYTYRRRGKGSQYSSPKYYEVPIFGQSEEERVGPIRAEQQRLAGIQQASYEKQQGDIASQLKIVQEEKSAVSKMMADYSDMLIREAEARKKAQEQAARDFEAQREAQRVAARTASANRLMEGRAANLQIQPAGTTPRTGGTQQFRRRVTQQGTASPYKGLSTIQSGMVNV